ncbi:MAG TPA: hypothetical protein VJH88_01220 [Candidatus Nanoarchaeia archaeon]|nr:hypothetical protein [Candidatus Nanoarchaeia archaeon]
MTEIETATMSERGQIIIPKDVREYINAGEKTIFTVMPLNKETIIMKKLDREKIVQEFQKMRESVTDKLTSKEINEIIAEVRKQK